MILDGVYFPSLRSEDAKRRLQSALKCLGFVEDLGETLFFNEELLRSSYKQNSAGDWGGPLIYSYPEALEASNSYRIRVVITNHAMGISNFVSSYMRALRELTLVNMVAEFPHSEPMFVVHVDGSVVEFSKGGMPVLEMAVLQLSDLTEEMPDMLSLPDGRLELSFSSTDLSTRYSARIRAFHEQVSIVCAAFFLQLPTPSHPSLPNLICDPVEVQVFDRLFYVYFDFPSDLVPILTLFSLDEVGSGGSEWFLGFGVRIDEKQGSRYNHGALEEWLRLYLPPELLPTK